MEGRAKPAMIAYKELRTRSATKFHGAIPDVPIGITLRGRGEVAIVGLHTQLLSGIDSNVDDACYAVCLSGGYADDEDGNGDGSIVYTGAGGQDSKRRQVKDQTKNCDNASLLRSIRTQKPIRVIRKIGNSKTSTLYYYEGLYQCTAYTYEASCDGPMVYKFTLVPIQGQSRPRYSSVTSRYRPLPSKLLSNGERTDKKKYETKQKNAILKRHNQHSASNLMNRLEQKHQEETRERREHLRKRNEVTKSDTFVIPRRSKKLKVDGNKTC